MEGPRTEMTVFPEKDGANCANAAEFEQQNQRSGIGLCSMVLRSISRADLPVLRGLCFRAGSHEDTEYIERAVINVFRP